MLVHLFLSLPILHAAENPSRGNRQSDLLHHPPFLCFENFTSYLSFSNTQFFAVVKVWPHSFGVVYGHVCHNMAEGWRWRSGSTAPAPRSSHHYPTSQDSNPCLCSVQRAIHGMRNVGKGFVMGHDRWRKTDKAVGKEFESWNRWKVTFISNVFKHYVAWRKASGSNRIKRL
jgi:hypothetical protein